MTFLAQMFFVLATNANLATRCRGDAGFWTWFSNGSNYIALTCFELVPNFREHKFARSLQKVCVHVVPFNFSVNEFHRILDWSTSSFERGSNVTPYCHSWSPNFYCWDVHGNFAFQRCSWHFVAMSCPRAFGISKAMWPNTPSWGTTS